MKFSVLLPTRNRLELLKFAVESVLKQDWSNWEVIVYDNHSEEDIAGYVRSLSDERVKYFRTDEFVSVTDNWNNAIEKSTGDYVLMLGDDDSLMKGYFSTLNKLIEKEGAADFIYTSAIIYGYPGVMPRHPKGFLRNAGYSSFLKNAKTPFWLSKDEAVSLAKQSANFKSRIGFNMQYVLINQKFVQKLSVNGKFFQSPFPDFYTMNAMFLQAEKILIYPKPMVIIGITPKSFGYYYFNRAEKRGVDFLNNASSSSKEVLASIKSIIVPGSHMNTSWLLSMEELKKNLEPKIHLDVNYKRYQFLQMLRLFADYSMDSSVKNDLKELRKLAKIPASKFYCMQITANTLRLLPIKLRSMVLNRLIALIGSYFKMSPKLIRGKYQTMREVYEDSELLKEQLQRN